MSIRVVHCFEAKGHRMFPIMPDRGNVGSQLQSDDYLIIKIPDLTSTVLRLLARSMLLALLIVSFPWIGSVFGSTALSFDEPVLGRELGYVELFFRDLKNEGILKPGDKSVLISNGDEDAIYSPQFLIENEMDIVSATDLERQNAIPKESFDFIFTDSFHGVAEFIDRTLKVGGIAAIKMSKNPSFAFEKPSNYEIFYLNQFDSTIMGMRKTNDNTQTNSDTKRRLLSALDAKKDALKNLEDVLLEPPRAASRRSSRYLKRTKYLPDLTGDTLESYPRRVFIDVGFPDKGTAAGSGTAWFANNYPTRNLDFEMYKIETVTEESSSGKEVTVPQKAEIGMSSWLRKNVNEEEYVVMKAEAEVVEEMVKSKAIKLVDELFLECKPKGLGGRKSSNYNGGKRAYWECLALYGRLRDEGVAVHQWWG